MAQRHIGILTNQHVDSLQLENYLAGNLAAPTMHQIEKHLLSCAFCADALAGLKTMPQQQIKPNIKINLKQKLAKRAKVNPQKPIISLWQNMGLAASVLLIVSASAYFLYRPKINEQFVVSPKKEDVFIDEKESPIIVQNDRKQQEKLPTANILSDNVPKYNESTTPTENTTTGFNDGDGIFQGKEETEKIASVAEPKKPTEVGASTTSGSAVVIETRPPAPPASVTPAMGASTGKYEYEKANTKITRKDSPIATGETERYQQNKAKKNVQQEVGYMAIGKVSDEMGNGLPGVTVQIRGQNIGTQTDFNGNYSLNNVQKSDVLQFNSVGMNFQEIAIPNASISVNNPINVTLTENNTSLAEVVVVGYDRNSVEESGEREPQSQDWRAFKQYIKLSLKYPSQAAEKKIKGRVIAKITLAPNGSVKNINLTKKIGFGCDEEAIRLLNNFAWKAPQKTETIRVGIRFGN